jgi:hypothetical protein
MDSKYTDLDPAFPRSFRSGSGFCIAEPTAAKLFHTKEKSGNFKKDFKHYIFRQGLTFSAHKFFMAVPGTVLVSFLPALLLWIWICSGPNRVSVDSDTVPDPGRVLWP